VYFTIQGVVLGLVVGGIFALGFGVAFVVALRAPGSVTRNAPTRACFVLTNRRLLVHQGTGSQMAFSGGSAAVTSDMSRLQHIISWTGLELTGLTRGQPYRFEGAGDLSFGRTVMEDVGTWHLWALDRVCDVEKMLREKLIHPLIDKLLRGELLAQEEKKQAQQQKGDDEVVHDGNIKDYARKGGVLDFDIKTVPAEDREPVEKELTAGEKILWIGEPEGSARGRGLVGALTGAARPIEPDYELYALTNRRVILWVKKEAPRSYYSPAVAESGVEEDSRIEKGGSIIFKKVKRTIITEDKQGNVKSKRVEIHAFGLLRIRNYKAVAQLLYDTLIAPCRGL
jgi:hypothetical protein